jgi:hypothetical protein
MNINRYRVRIQFAGNDRFWQEDMTSIFQTSTEMTAKEIIKQELTANYFTRISEWNEMFVDTESGEALQIGWICRASTEIDGKKVRFDCWCKVDKLESLI